jgi:hypothetical protein
MQKRKKGGGGGARNIALTPTRTGSMISIKQLFLVGSCLSSFDFSYKKVIRNLPVKT